MHLDVQLSVVLLQIHSITWRCLVKFYINIINLLITGSFFLVIKILRNKAIISGSFPLDVEPMKSTMFIPLLCSFQLSLLWTNAFFCCCVGFLFATLTSSTWLGEITLTLLQLSIKWPVHLQYEQKSSRCIQNPFWQKLKTLPSNQDLISHLLSKTHVYKHTDKISKSSIKRWFVCCSIDANRFPLLLAVTKIIFGRQYSWDNP